MPPSRIDHTTKDGNTSIKAALDSKSSRRKYTLSCSRCRASKLKCDTREPCMECMKRNIGHLCTKDERQPRAKKAKTNDNNNIASNTGPSQLQEEGAVEAAQVLEHFVNGTTHIHAYPSTVLEPATSLVAQDYPMTYWLTTDHPQRHYEKLTLIREIVDSITELDVIHALHEIFITRCQGPLGNIVHTPTFMRQAKDFCIFLGLESVEAQVSALSNTFSMDTLAIHLLALVLALAFHPSPSLIGWSSTAVTLRVEEFRASDIRSKKWRSLALRCLQGGASLFCGSIASLQAAIMLLLDGQEEPLALDAILVTGISGAQKLGLHRMGDAKLEVSASPASSSGEDSSTWTEPVHIRTEIGVRIWWALVMRDWSKAQDLGYYSIHPSQFNTRRPLHINDDDLCAMTSSIDVHGQVSERPRSEFTMLSYTVHALEIATFTRESIDLRAPLHLVQRQEGTNEFGKMRIHLNKKYESFVAGLPSYFRLGSTLGLTSTGPMAAIPVQRWMLHQQLWSLLLRLHRTSLLSSDGRTSCLHLAQNIISTQAQIQVRCAVCGSLSTSDTQLFNAATVLLVDLLFSSEYRDADCSSAQLNRLMTRDKIREAIDLLQGRSGAEGSSSLVDPLLERVKASAQRSIIALEALMKLEEDESHSDGKGNKPNSTQDGLEGQVAGTDSSENISLKKKVMGILESLLETAKPAALAREQASSISVSEPEMFMPLPTFPDGFQDLDVLPVLSNDPSFDLWHFLDFTDYGSPTEFGSSSATEELHTLVNST